MIENVTDSVIRITQNDNIDLFESMYPVPDGVCYNSYVILDDKTAVLDTMDSGVTDEWINDLRKVLGDRSVDYIVIHHMEPDHSANISKIVKEHPEAKIVVNKMSSRMLDNYFADIPVENRVIVENGDSICLGKHNLTFVMAQNVHWPEVMLSYDSFEKILFSADAFGRFGPYDPSYEWDDEARRYYFNIVGKFGDYVIPVLDKAATLDISVICPLHGPVLNEDLGKYLGLYRTWASYEPETDGVFIAYTSVYGHTAEAAKMLADELSSMDTDVQIYDLSRTHISYAVSDAFRFNRTVLMTTTYENGIFPTMEWFVRELGHKNFRNRNVAVVDNGSWGPVAGKQIKELLSSMEGITIVEPSFSIKSAMKESDAEKIKQLAKALSSI